MTDSENIPLHFSSQSDIDEIENLLHISVDPVPLAAGAGKPSSAPPATIPVSSSPPLPPPQQPPRSVDASTSAASSGLTGFGPAHTTLTEPVWATLKRDLLQVVNNLRTVVFPNPYRKDSDVALRDWDLWGPFFFVIFLAFILSYSAAADRAKVFAVVFAVLSAGAIVLTLNVVLLGGSIIFLQSLSVLGYCLFPLDIGASICMAKDNKIFRSIIVLLTVAWSSWAVYPFVSTAVPPSRKALAVYPVLLLYVSMGFLVLANN
ncbi:hypothetical protein O6H91_06G140000 [Diphasiastrum complanatum]|uniref:Uncharacterized protein n=1 Tax=Diphasiastrum complanatum TaxID=34168 RepID=A0ACC2DJF5_DIPCM|nr:hypothetical protein O6H91_Y532000 [Diphasiastrum complanatum]KAJ7554428.1 hypothetical protein O6H91_06G140000 [Diphasiastrum complanatum]